MKRFYKGTSTAKQDGGFVVLLDDRPVKTPKRAILALPTQALADAVAREWAEQGEEIDPGSMVLMRLATTAIDRVSYERTAIEDDLAAYGGSDLLCYRTQSPVELAERQAEVWQPLLDWAAARHDALLAVTTGLVAVEQPATAREALRRALEALDDYELMAAHTFTVATGSLVIALAVLAGEIEGEKAFEAGALDDLYGMEVWGEDKEGRERLEGLKNTILAAERMLALLRTG
tara:strand:- start:170 stop:868 length:699 start_codon:yes stop_codon:yes gene_type:complete